MRGLLKHATNVPALAIGILIGGVLLSGVAVAAAPGLVTIADSAGANKASVNGAGQLLAAESNPRNTVIAHGSTNVISTCASVYTVPAGKALIIKSVTFFTQKNGSNPEIDLLKNSCGVHLTAAVTAPATVFASQLQSWPLGLPVASGKTVDIICFETAVCAVDLVGYLVPSTLVPASDATPNKQAPGRAGMRTR